MKSTKGIPRIFLAFIDELAMTSNSTYPSTTSLRSETTVSSTTPLTDEGKERQKNFSSALGRLQGRYGTTGKTPVPVHSPASASSSDTLPHSAAASSPAATSPLSLSKIQSENTGPPTGVPKNFEAAFGGLASSYGPGGSFPTLPRKKSDNKPKKQSMLAKLFKGDKKRHSDQMAPNDGGDHLRFPIWLCLSVEISPDS